MIFFPISSFESAKCCYLSWAASLQWKVGVSNSWVLRNRLANTSELKWANTPKHQEKETGTGFLLTWSFCGYVHFESHTGLTSLWSAKRTFCARQFFTWSKDCAVISSTPGCFWVVFGNCHLFRLTTSWKLAEIGPNIVLHKFTAIPSGKEREETLWASSAMSLLLWRCDLIF